MSRKAESTSIAIPSEDGKTDSNFPYSFNGSDVDYTDKDESSDVVEDVCFSTINLLIFLTLQEDFEDKVRTVRETAYLRSVARLSPLRRRFFDFFEEQTTFWVSPLQPN